MNPSFIYILCVRLFLLFIFITTTTRTNRYFAGAEPAPNEQQKTSIESKDEKSIEKQLAELSSHLLPADYNRDIRPGYGSGRPVKMAVSIAINDISSISEAAMDLKVDFYIRHYWTDDRLAFASKIPLSTAGNNRSQIKQLTLGEAFARRLWLPDTEFENAKSVEIHKSVSAAETTLLRVGSLGQITYSTRISMTARCPMQLALFPLDQQRCSIILSSYGELEEDVLYSWAEGNSRTPVEFHPHIYLPQFRLLGYSRSTSRNALTTGNFSRLQLELFFARSVGFYVAQVYIPAALVVIISWLPFWLDRHDHHARVALGVTTVLTMTTLSTNVNAEFPKISYVKAIDVYLFTSFLFVFFSLIEYAIVGYYEFSRSTAPVVLAREVSSSSDEDENDSRDEEEEEEEIY